MNKYCVLVHLAMKHSSVPSSSNKLCSTASSLISYIIVSTIQLKNTYSIEDKFSKTHKTCEATATWHFTNFVLYCIVTLDQVQNVKTSVLFYILWRWYITTHTGRRLVCLRFCTREPLWTPCSQQSHPDNRSMTNNAIKNSFNPSKLKYVNF